MNIINKIIDNIGIVMDAIVDAQRKYGRGTGSTKKQVVVSVINQLIDIPYIPEKLEGILIGYTVDLTVAGLKWLGERLGHGEDWIKIFN